MTITPFNQGSQAFMDERSTTECHFAEGSTMRRQWVEGWSHRQVQERALRQRSIGELYVHESALELLPRTLERLTRSVVSAV